MLGDLGGTPGTSCRRHRAASLRRLAADYSLCMTRAESDPGEPFDLCEAEARWNFARGWSTTLAGCTAVDATAGADRLESEIDDTASRLTVRCGDGRLAGYEECDDGEMTDGDGCSADCRNETCTTDETGTATCSVCPGGCAAETCKRVDGDVRCVACPAGSVPDESYHSCRCPDGYSGVPGACADIDECAAAADPCVGIGPCVNLLGSWSCETACTAAAFHAALASCGAPSGTITFGCTDTTIALPGGAGANQRDISCNHLTIDGAGRNITFELAPLCWQTRLDASLCPSGLAADGTCSCPNVDSGDAFLVLRGDDNVVRDLTIRGFFDGIHTRGAGNVVENVRFDRMCDDAFGNGPGGRGNLFRDLVVREGCDKCSENAGSIVDTDEDTRVAAHYNAIFQNVDFDTCGTPVRVASTGRYLLDNVTMAAGTDEFPCDGPRFSSSTGVPGDLAVTILASRIEGCRRGLRIGAGADVAVRSTRIADCELRGIRVAPTARVSIEDSTIVHNGGGGSAEDGYGGVAAIDGAAVDLGGGSVVIDGAATSSAGNNSLCDNRGAGGGRLDLFNGSATTPVAAANNWWCSTDPASDRIAGGAGIDPLLTRAPDSFIP